MANHKPQESSITKLSTAADPQQHRQDFCQEERLERTKNRCRTAAQPTLFSERQNQVFQKLTSKYAWKTLYFSDYELPIDPPINQIKQSNRIHRKIQSCMHKRLPRTGETFSYQDGFTPTDNGPLVNWSSLQDQPCAPVVLGHSTGVHSGFTVLT